MAEQEIAFEHDEERQTFGVKVKKDWVELEYRANREGKFFITGIQGPPQLVNDGVSVKLIEHTLGYIRENGYSLIPSCKPIKDYLRDHPECHDLVATGIRVV